jgi:colicin import membrane protein
MQIEELTAGIASVSSEVAKFDGIAAGLAALEKAHPKDIACEVTTTAGMKQAIAGRAAWREPRIAVEKARKAAKAPVLELGRAIDTFAKELETKLLAGESHYDDQIKAEEARKEALRIEAAKRVLKLQADIDAIKAYPAQFAGQHSDAISLAFVRMESEPPAGYDEFQKEADAAHAAALTQLHVFYTAAVEREQEAARIKAEQEAEAARLKAEREELARLRAEQEKRDAEARAAQAEADRLERQRIAAERAKLEEEQRAARAEQKRLDDEAAAARRAADAAAAAERAEADRIAREARAVEQALIDSMAAERRLKEQAEATARREAEEEERARRAAAIEAQEAAQRRLHGAAQKLLDALILAVPFVSDTGTLETCNAAISEATGE